MALGAPFFWNDRSVTMLSPDRRHARAEYARVAIDCASRVRLDSTAGVCYLDLSIYC